MRLGAEGHDGRRLLRCLGAALVLLGAYTLAADLVAASGSWPVAAALSRAALAPTCHQMPERSFHLGDRPLGACARCVGLHAGGLAGGALLLLAGVRRRPGAGGGATILLLGVAPLALDGLAGQLVSGWDHPGLRFATGVVAAAAVAWAARGTAWSSASTLEGA